MSDNVTDRNRAVPQAVLLQGHEDWVWHAAFSPDGTRVSTASEDGTARLWDASDGTPLVVLDHGDIVWNAAFSPDGTRVVTSCADRRAYLWEIGP